MSSRASLNHIFRTVWNQALGAMVAVAEISSDSGGRSKGARNRGKDRLQAPPWSSATVSVLSLGIAVAWGALPASALANPGGGVAIAGQASMVNQGNKLTVTTQNAAGSNYSAINWQSFSVPAGNTTYFQQPNAGSTSINRVVTNTPSLLFGTLGSNGNLVLVNQSGIAVGTGAVVDTAGFTASSLRMSDADALGGRLRFGDGSAAAAAVSVQGSILARSGDVVLLGSRVDTGKDALIQAPNGSTILAAGQQIELTGRGLEGITLQVQAPADQAINLGTLQGDAVGIFAGTLRHSGLIQATAASLEGGKVVLKAAAEAYVDGSGRILATGTAGGTVDVLGNRVAVMDQAVIDVSGEQGGGSVRVGGDYQGKNPDVQNANITYFGPQASINADAKTRGDGGKVIVWADDTTRAFGNISARGGAQGGSGGFVEVSGRRYLDFQGMVDTSAVNGRAGTLLLDPSNITISATASSSNMSGASPFQDVLGYGSSILGVSTLQSALATGGVVVNASSGGAVGYAGDITVATPVAWSSANGLTLQTGASGAIAINASISAGGSLRLNAGGNLTIGAGGSITSSAPGDAVVMVVGGALGGYAGSITFSGGGRWLAYLKEPGTFSSSNGFSAFKQYYAPFGSTVLGSGNGVLYENTTTPAVLTSGSPTSPVDALTGLVSKVYDGGLVISLSGATYNQITGGFINGDQATQGAATATGGTGSLSDPNVGTAKLVTASNVTVTQMILGGGFNAVYGYQVRGYIGEVTPAQVISSIDLFGSRVYDGTNIVNASIFSLSGLVSGETLTLTGSGTVADKNVGVNKLVSLGSLALADGTGSASNYTFSGGTQVATITAAPITGVSGITAANKVYDGTTAASVSAAAASLAGAIGGDSLSVAGTGTFSDKNAGLGKTVNITGLTLGGTDAANYTLGSTTASSSADIGKATISAVSGITATNKVYDGNTTATVNTALATLAGAISGDNLSVTGAGAFIDKNAGLGKTVNITGLTLGGTDAANYTLGSSTSSTTANITPANLSVTANNATKTYDSIAYSGGNGVSYAGFVNSETAAVLGGALTYSGTSQGAVNAGSYLITPGGLASGNYSFNYVNGILTVSPVGVGVIGLNGTRVYDGTNIVNADIFTITGLLGGDTLSLTGSGTVGDKNVGLNKPVTQGSLSLGNGSGLASNYTLSGGTQVATITPATITAVSNITASNKVYDGNTTATVNTAAATLAGAISGDNVTIGAVTAAFVDRHVGVGKTVNITNVALTGTDAANYIVASGIAPTQGTITVRPLSTWAAAGGGLWSEAGNWDALPDGSNVLAVAIPAGVTVVYDTPVGATNLQSINSAGTVTLADGNLSVAGSLTTPQYSQTGGSLNVAGSLNVNGSFNQSGGTIGIDGSATISQNSGNLSVGSLRASSIDLSALNGSIVQSAALVTGGLLSTRSGAGTLLNDAGNRVGSFKAATTGAGNIELTNVGVLDVQDINAANGNVALVNTGAISTSGTVVANGGTVSMIANSPLTIGSGGVLASGDITLTATNLTSAGDMTLNGDLTSSGGAITLDAANNFVQNSTLTAARGITVTAGGSMTFGPNANSLGNPISYRANGLDVLPPGEFWYQASIPSDFVLAFLIGFDNTVTAQYLGNADPFKPPSRDRNGVVVEGEICSR